MNKFFSFDASGGIFMSSGTGADAGLRDDLASGGAALVALTDEQTIGGRLLETLSVGDDGASAAASDSASVIAATFDAQKQPWSITYTDGGAVVMTPEHSVDIPAQYTIKSSIPVWSKTAARAKQDLNSGMTLAGDATDDAIFLIGGSTNQPEWVNQVTIEGGAYSSLKAGGALLRPHPTFPVPEVLGESFITNLTVRNITYAGDEGIMLGGYYCQSCLFENIRFVGRANTLIHVAGHHLVLRNIDKTGWTGDSAAPLIRIGDPDNISPTTNVLVENTILDLNGDAGKTSIHIVNAKRVTLKSVHHEMFTYDQSVHIENSFTTRMIAPAWATSRTDAIITLDDSDLYIDLWESGLTKNWLDNFELNGSSRLTIGTLRIYFGGVVPLERGVDVHRIDHVQTDGTIKTVQLRGGDELGNLVPDPTFQNGSTGISTGGVGTPTLTPTAGNKADPNGQILRVTYAADASGYAYVFIPMPTMTGRIITFGMKGEIDLGVGVDGTNTFMGVAGGDFAVNEGRIYPEAGYVLAAGATQTGPGTLVVGIANPRADTNYDIHMVAACYGEQLSMTVPARKAASVADPAGGATVDAECRAAVGSLIDAFQASGGMKA